MSRFSSKCDLADHFYIRYVYDKDGKDRDLVSAFKNFLKDTGGVIYKAVKIAVNKNNIEFLKEHDELAKKGLYQLKKGEVACVRVPIKIESYLDLVKYFPYITSVVSGDYIEIGEKSFPDRQLEERYFYGCDGIEDSVEMYTYFNNNLREYIKEIISNPEYKEII